MSVHLVTCAAQLPLRSTEKLILLCLAENANAKDSVAFPGMEGLMRWSGLSDARVYQVLKALQELRLIEQIGRGHRGRAAEFVVFPYGCCEAHGKEACDWPEAIGAVETVGSRRLSPRKPPVSAKKASSFEAESLRRVGPPPTTPHTDIPRVSPIDVGETDADRPALRIISDGQASA